MATRRDSKPPIADLSTLSDRELLLYVHQDLSRQIAGVLVEVAGVRDAVVRLEAGAAKTDALITDMRRLAVRVTKNEERTGQVEANVKLAYGRIVDLEDAKKPAAERRRSRG